MSKLNIVQFLSQVKQEAAKVTWSTKKETITATWVVLIMIVISSLYFFLVDNIIFNSIRTILAL